MKALRVIQKRGINIIEVIEIIIRLTIITNNCEFYTPPLVEGLSLESE